MVFGHKLMLITHYYTITLFYINDSATFWCSKHLDLTKYLFSIFS